MNLTKLNLPEYNFKFKENLIFDEIRKKYIVLTPEEWVRQNIIKFLIKNLNYPAHLIGIEKQIKVFGTIKRPDIIIFDKKLEPIMIVECKKTNIKITEKTLNQTINYFIELKPKYFLLTNGIRHYCCKITNNSCFFLKQIPNYNEL
jgi:hypothetical protein